MDWTDLRKRLQAVIPGADVYASQTLRLVILDIIIYLEEKENL